MNISPAREIENTYQLVSERENKKEKSFKPKTSSWKANVFFK